MSTSLIEDTRQGPLLAEVRKLVVPAFTPHITAANPRPRPAAPATPPATGLA